MHIADIVAIGSLLAVAIGGLVGWQLRVQGRVSKIEQALIDAAKLSAQAIANLSEESRASIAHLRELRTLDSATWQDIKDAVKEGDEEHRDIKERLVRIEANTNGKGH